MKRIGIIRKGIAMSVLLVIGACNMLAQTSSDRYTKQLAALEKSFSDKSPEPLKEHLSPDLKFRRYPASATGQILNTLISRFPALNSLKVLEEEEGMVLLHYNFDELGEKKSALRFDSKGLITEFELIENILKEGEEVQRERASQKQAPTPGLLAEKYPGRAVSFKAADGLTVFGQLYEVSSDAPVILLCHQAGYNKYEYADIAPKLNEMGYNALAIDQRSGGPFAEHENKTQLAAKDKGLDTEMVSAEPDLKAGVDYLAEKYGREVILWGSSYSSSLALHVGASHNKVSAVIAFSPNDYFGDAKPKLNAVLSDFQKPFLITSSGREVESTRTLLKGVALSAHQSQFVPEGSGFHGSRALWTDQKGGEQYWAAVKSFLKKLE